MLNPSCRSHVPKRPSSLTDTSGISAGAGVMPCAAGFMLKATTSAAKVGARGAGRLHSSRDLSQSLRRGQLPPVFALAAGLARRGFRVRNFTYDEGRSCDTVLAAEAARALPIVTKR